MSKYTSQGVEIPTLEQLENEREYYRHRRRYNRTFGSTLSVLLVAAAVSVLVATLWMPVLQVFGTSMSPTLEDRQIVVSVKGRSYQQGDLIAFYYGNKLLIKRVIACSGDWISIEENGDVYVNGLLLEEPYAVTKALGDCEQTFPLQVGEGRCFVLGDNRTVSMDSRSSMIGCVSEEQIVGKIVLRVWPLSRFGTVD